MAGSDYNWRLWGERDRYFGVLTDPRFRKENIEANRQIFFEGGQSFVRHWLGELERCFGALPRSRALDFGCGVGRLSIPLSDYFESVVGIDISHGMLEEARANSEGRNIEYLLSDDELSAVDGTFDLVTSVIVFQHIPVNRGMALLSRLLGRVRAGGGCLIQFSTNRNYNWWSELRYRVRHDVPGGQAVMNLLERRAADTPVMQMNEYSLDAVLALFRTYGFEELLVRFDRHGDTETAMVFSRLR